MLRQLGLSRELVGAGPLRVADHSPLSVFGRFSGFTSNSYGDTGNASSEYAGMLGVKVHFGSSTLLSKDRTGTTLKAPDFSPIGWLATSPQY